MVYAGLIAAAWWLLRRLRAKPAMEEAGAMTLALACLLVILAGLSAYAVLAGADFGAGVWDLTAGGAERGGRVRGMVQRSMSPVWEANHVWLILVLVVLWTAFPVAFGSIFSTLYMPLFGAMIGIIFRGAAFALRGQAATIGEARGLGATFALASLLVPFFLGTVLGGIASGRVPVGNAAGDVWSSWLNPTSLTVGVLAVLTGAYLAAVYMAADSVRAELPDMERAFRARALAAGALAGAVAIGALPVLASDAPDLYDGLTTASAWSCVLGSGLFGVATLAWSGSSRFGAARCDRGRGGGGRGGRLGRGAEPRPAARRADAGAGGRRRLHADRLPGQPGRGRAGAGAVAGLPLPAGAARHAGPELRAAGPEVQAQVTLFRATVACGVLGVGLLFPFDATDHAGAGRGLPGRLHRLRRVPDRRAGVPRGRRPKRE